MCGLSWGTAGRCHSHFSDDSENLPEHRHGVKHFFPINVKFARAAPGLRGPDVAEAAEQIDREFDQLRAAHGWALATDLGLASRIVPDPVSGGPMVVPIGRHRTSSSSAASS